MVFLFWHTDKTLPVIILKTVLIYGRVRQVKIQFTFWVKLQIPKYTNCLTKVPNSWHSKVNWQQWSIQKDVNMYNHHFPMNLSDDLLEALHTIYLQLWRLSQPWVILAIYLSHTLQWRPSSIPGNNIFNVGYFCIQIILTLHSPVYLIAFQRHIENRCSKVCVRLCNIFIFEIKTLLYPTHIFDWISWYANHIIKIAPYVFMVIKSTGLHWWQDPNIWLCVACLVPISYSVPDWCALNSAQKLFNPYN